MAFPELKAERLILRATKDADGAAIYPIFSDPDVTLYYDIGFFPLHRRK